MMTDGNRAALASWLRRELEDCRSAYEGGARGALVDALALCVDMPEITPKWLLAAALDVASAANIASAGRPARPLIHLERWSIVKKTRERQSAFRLHADEHYGKGEIAHSQRMLAPPRASDKLTGAVESGGHTWEDAYVVASIVLHGTAARGEPAAMRKSYLATETEIKGQKRAALYLPKTDAGRKFAGISGQGTK